MFERRVSLGFTRFRIERNDGSAGVEYRIESGRVQRRALEAAQKSAPTEAQWELLTPPQLASEVMSNRVLATWLYRRLGIQALLRACSQHPLSASDEGQEFPNRANGLFL